MLKYNIVNSGHTKGKYSYMNCKRKLLYCNANINFDIRCLKEKRVPKYAYMKIPLNNKAAKKTKAQTQTLCIKNEIKFLSKETTIKHTTAPSPHTQRKHMATEMGQH
jgi:hypothetical protein